MGVTANAARTLVRSPSRHQAYTDCHTRGAEVRGSSRGAAARAQAATMESCHPGSKTFAGVAAIVTNAEAPTIDSVWGLRPTTAASEVIDAATNARVADALSPVAS